MHVITALTDRNHEIFAQYLSSSCRYFDLQLKPLVLKGRYSSHRIKDELLLGYLNNLGNDELVLFTDAYDTVFLAGEKEIALKFKAFNRPLVFSAEINCWPDARMKGLYPPSSHHFKYLNSGAFMGVASFIAEIYRRYSSVNFDKRFEWSNQYYWHQIYLSNLNDIAIDHDCQLFFNHVMPLEECIQIDFNTLSPTRLREIYSVEKRRLDAKLSLSGGRYFCSITNSYPCHLHFPGPISKLLIPEYFGAFKESPESH